MDLLHAYWRMEYIQSPQAEKGEGHANPFEALPQLGDDRKALIVWRGEYVYLLLNKYPYNPGHLLACPYRVEGELENLSEAERNELMAAIVRAKRMITAAMNPDGFNIGFNFGVDAGAGIPQHLHAHIVPRWKGDTNFMPVIGRTRTLPQALDQTWEALRAHA